MDNNLVEILLVGTDIQVVKIIIRLINNNPQWNASSAMSVVDAKLLMLENNFRILLIGAGLTNLEESELCVFTKSNFTTISIVQHYGGGSGLLSAEILNALNYN